MEKFTQEMLARLDALAAKLGVAASAIWNFYIRQARIEGLLYLVYLACTLGCCVFCVFLAKRRVSAFKRDRNIDHIGCAVPLFLVASGFLAWSCFNLHESITALGNPGYFAFQAIIDQLKGQ